MPSVNRVILIGRLGRDPDMQYTPEGQAVTRFSLATDRYGPPGSSHETDWHQVVCFGKVAEFAGECLDKGRLVCVMGRITYHSWEAKEGQKRRTTEIIASEVVGIDYRPLTNQTEIRPNRRAGDLPSLRLLSHRRSLLCVIRFPQLSHAAFARDVALIASFRPPLLRRLIVYRRLRPLPPDSDGVANAA